MESLRKKLGVLREAQRGLQEDIRANAQLGEEMESLVLAICKPNEVDKPYVHRWPRQSDQPAFVSFWETDPGRKHLGLWGPRDWPLREGERNIITKCKLFLGCTKYRFSINIAMCASAIVTSQDVRCLVYWSLYLYWSFSLLIHRHWVYTGYVGPTCCTFEALKQMY